MGGKSTLLRMLAVHVILAQMGSLVPAQSLELDMVDRIFTRLGARRHSARWGGGLGGRDRVGRTGKVVRRQSRQERKGRGGRGGVEGKGGSPLEPSRARRHALCSLSPGRIRQANDDIMKGQSTFMVELSEAAVILHESTARSLVVIDELGRGTSTFDGAAIAFAVGRHLVSRSGCRAIFATHYHAVAGQLAREFPARVQTMHMAHAEEAEEGEEGEGDNDGLGPREARPRQRAITFLFELRSQLCGNSYGHVGCARNEAATGVHARVPLSLASALLRPPPARTRLTCRRQRPRSRARPPSRRPPGSTWRSWRGWTRKCWPWPSARRRTGAPKTASASPPTRVVSSWS